MTKSKHPAMPKPGQLVFAVDLSPAEAVLVLSKDVIGVGPARGWCLGTYGDL